jgi:hypothetical protein
MSLATLISVVSEVNWLTRLGLDWTVAEVTVAEGNYKKVRAVVKYGRN